MCGGYSEDRAPDDHVKKLVKDFESQIKSQLKGNADTLEVVSFKSQVVAGMNYDIRIKVDGSKFINVVIYETLPCYDEPNQLTKVVEHP